MFWKWLYIRDDDNWLPVHIWDIVKIINQWFWIEEIEKYNYWSDGVYEINNKSREIPETTIIWKLCLSKTKWVYIHIYQQFEKYEDDNTPKEKQFYEWQNRQFTYLKITNRTKRIQEWELLKNNDFVKRKAVLNPDHSNIQKISCEDLPF